MGLVYHFDGRLFVIKKVVTKTSPLYKTVAYKKTYLLLFHPACFIRGGSILSC